MMLEKQVEAFFNREVAKLGGLSRKWQNQQNRGVPDRIAFMPDGRVFFVELKRDGQKPSKLQEAEHRKIRETGTEVYVLAGKQEVIEWLGDYSNGLI